jgi:hypothetical protein
MDVLDSLQCGADAAFERGGTFALVDYLLQADINRLLTCERCPSPASALLHPDNVCVHCHGDLTPDVREGNWICLGCGSCTYMDASVQVMHGGTVAWADTLHTEIRCQYRPYNRRSRLMDVLNQAQNSKTASLPPHAMVALQQVFGGVSDKQTIKVAHLRHFMKMKGWGKYYKYIPQALYVLKGTRTPPLHQDTRRRVMARFARMQRVFEEVIKPTFKRKNFLNYSYVTRQCLFLEGAPVLLQENYSVTTDPARLFKLDRMWKVMCESLGWTFRPLSIKGIKAFGVPKPSHAECWTKPSVPC